MNCVSINQNCKLFKKFLHILVEEMATLQFTSRFHLFPADGALVVIVFKFIGRCHRKPANTEGFIQRQTIVLVQSNDNLLPFLLLPVPGHLFDWTTLVLYNCKIIGSGVILLMNHLGLFTLNKSEQRTDATFRWVIQCATHIEQCQRSNNFFAFSFAFVHCKSTHHHYKFF